MTKKDYILIARVLSSRKPVNTDATQAEFDARFRQWQSIVEKMAEELGKENNAFDPARFEKACNQ